jgi:hypothetical protein
MSPGSETDDSRGARSGVVRSGTGRSPVGSPTTRSNKSAGGGVNNRRRRPPDGAGVSVAEAPAAGTGGFSGIDNNEAITSWAGVVSALGSESAAERGRLGMRKNLETVESAGADTRLA